MRVCLACLNAVGLLLIAAAFAPDRMCRVTLTLTDADTGRTLFGHSSAVYVTIDGRTIRSAADVAWLRHEVEAAHASITEKAPFDTAEQRAKVLGLYDQALQELSK